MINRGLIFFCSPQILRRVHKMVETAMPKNCVIVYIICRPTVYGEVYYSNTNSIACRVVW